MKANIWGEICEPNGSISVSGGKLKTLAEQDSESLQANWFTLEQIEKGLIELR